jgi:hypothetical protein
MNKYAASLVLIVSVFAMGLQGQGCAQPDPQYGTERPPTSWPGHRRQVWAVAPAIELSGQRDVDPLLQADLVYQQLQEAQGITVVPVNRVVEVYASLRIDRVQSEDQAALVCDLLGCDALLVPTVTAFDPYNPPKLGASLQLFAQPGSFARPASIDVRELARRASPDPNESMPSGGRVFQVVGMYDAANGSVRQALLDYAAGRNDPMGPLGSKEYFVSMDRYCGFVYHKLIAELISMAGKSAAN